MPLRADAFSVAIVQDFDGVAVEDGDDESGEVGVGKRREQSQKKKELVKRAHYFTSQNLWRKKSPIPSGVTMAQGHRQGAAAADAAVNAGAVDVLCTHQEKIKAAPIEAESSNKEHHY
jgi:hypothetical protein